MVSLFLLFHPLLKKGSYNHLAIIYHVYAVYIIEVGVNNNKFEYWSSNYLGYTMSHTSTCPITYLHKNKHYTAIAIMRLPRFYSNNISYSIYFLVTPFLSDLESAVDSNNCYFAWTKIIITRRTWNILLSPAIN